MFSRLAFLLTVATGLVCVSVQAEPVMPDAPIASLGDLRIFLDEHPDSDCKVDLVAGVNYWDREWHSLYVQVDEVATFVQMPTHFYGNRFEVRGGDQVRIVGRYSTEAGSIFAEQIGVTARDVLPHFDDISMTDLALGDYWSRKIRISATVESAMLSSDRCQLILRDGDKRLFARLKRELTQEQINQVVGADITISGTLSYLVDLHFRPASFLCLSMAHDELVINRPGDLDLSNPVVVGDVSNVDIKSLPPDSFEISGQVGYVREYDFMVLEGRNRETVSIYAPFEADIQPGDFIRVVGVTKSADEVEKSVPELAAGEDSRGQLADVIAKLVFVEGRSNLPLPRRYRAADVVRDTIDRQRMAVSGEIVSIESDGFDRRLLVVEDGVQFVGEFTADDESFAALDLERVRNVTLAGLVEQVDGKPDSQFSIALVLPEGITIQSEWAQVDRRIAAGVAAGLLALLFAGSLFVLRLRGRVGDQRKDLDCVLARLNASYDAVHEALLVVDHELGVVGANAKTGAVLGVTVDDLVSQGLDTVGRRIANGFSDGDQFLSAWNEIQTDPDVTLELEFTTTDIPPRTLSMFTAPVVQRNGESDGRIWSFDDVSQRKQLEANLLQAQKMEAVGRLAGGVAHDFNNLLLAMMSNIQLARLQPETKASGADGFLVAADEAADRAAKLVKHLLGFSRMAQLEMRVGQPSQVVGQVEQLLVRTFDSRIQLEFDVGDDVWNVKMDAIQLEQVLLNICLNARDALKGSNDVIAVSADNVESSESPLGQQSVRIRVSDNGVGMPESVRDKIFDPFFTTKEPGKGTGLGLSMSFGIIEQHDGVIRCHTEPAVGTQFDIFLPRCLEAPNQEVSPPDFESSVGRASGRVLIADDETLVCDSVANSLRFHGFHVDTVTNGRAVLEHLRKTVHTDLVLLDLSMPVLSGGDALKQIQTEFPSVRVVVYSGYMKELEELKSNVAELPYALVSKPFKIAEIVELVRDAIEESGQSATENELPKGNSSVV